MTPWQKLEMFDFVNPEEMDIEEMHDATLDEVCSA